MRSRARCSRPAIRVTMCSRGPIATNAVARGGGGWGYPTASAGGWRRGGNPDGKPTVLYAPTYRDHVFDQRGRYRLDLRIDFERLRAAVGDDTVILFRKHHYIVDPVPSDPHGFVRDVPRYPDGTELMLAADVRVADFSSMMFDYANTGRPM